MNQTSIADPKQTKSKKMMLTAILLNGLGLLLIYYGFSLQSVICDPGRKTEVVISSVSIPSGTVLTADMIIAVQVPDRYRPKVSIPWTDRQLFLAKPTNVAISKGDYVLGSYFGN